MKIPHGRRCRFRKMKLIYQRRKAVMKVKKKRSRSKKERKKRSKWTLMTKELKQNRPRQFIPKNSYFPCRRRKEKGGRTPKKTHPKKIPPHGDGYISQYTAQYKDPTAGKFIQKTITAQKSTGSPFQMKDHAAKNTAERPMEIDNATTKRGRSDRGEGEDHGNKMNSQCGKVVATRPEEEKGATAQTLRAAWPTVAALAAEEEKKKKEREKRKKRRRREEKKGNNRHRMPKKGKSDTRKESP